MAVPFAASLDAGRAAAGDRMRTRAPGARTSR